MSQRLVIVYVRNVHRNEDLFALFWRFENWENSSWREKEGGENLKAMYKID